MNAAIEETLKRHGVTTYGIVPVERIALHKSFHDMCATNQCGKYGTNWSCPPGVGAYEDLVARLRQFDRALVIQTVWHIADSFDVEGMLESARNHNDTLRSLVDEIYPLMDAVQKLTLSAGACSLCRECSYIHRKPCTMPDRAFGSLEAYGVDVAGLLGLCGLKYNNGPNTVSYVGAVLHG